MTVTATSAMISVSFWVTNFAQGDYARVFWNAGNGAIDWDTPMDNRKYDLYPDDAGKHGFGHGNFGHHPFGHAHYRGVPGFGRLPFGKHPFGHGAVKITAIKKVFDPGYYLFGFNSYDSKGNKTSGTPEEIGQVVCLKPPTPSRLKKVSYNYSTKVLSLKT